MTDRELLELAAKAAGYDISHRWNAERMTMPNQEIGLFIPDVSTCWNPLDDDGDALRLADAVGMTEIKIVYDEWPDYEAGMIRKSPNAPATRRAIVRAAAEIGKEMK